MNAVACRSLFILRCLSLFICFCINKPVLVHGQTTAPYNRFQYQNYKWKVLRTPLFQLYFPQGYDSLASFASVQLPDIIAELKTANLTEVKATPNLILYPSVSKLYESNIGMHQEEVQTFPTINLKGDRLMLAFNGSYEDFRYQLKEAWMRLCWEEQFKNDAEQQLTGQKTLVPQWFKEGCIRWFAYGWEIKDEDALQQLLDKPSIATWNNIAEADASLSGQAFCYFLTHRYRQDAVMQCFFQMRQGKSLARAVRLVTKHKLDSLTNECLRYFKGRRLAGNETMFDPSDTLGSFLERQYKGRLFALEYNKDRTLLAFSIEKYNKREVFIVRAKEIADPEHKARPFTHYLLPPWLQQHDNDIYPLLNWQNNNTLTIFMPVKGQIKMLSFNEPGNPVTDRTLYGIDGINSASQWNASQWLLSAYRKSRSDIISYDVNTLRYTPLTTDNADHTALTWNRNNNSIVYRSGYPADSLYYKDTLAKPYGVYMKDLNTPLKELAKTKDVLIAKDTAFIHWTEPSYHADGTLTIKSTATGFLKTMPVNTYVLPVENKGNAASPWLKDYLKDLKVKDSIQTLLAKAGSGEPSFLQGVLQPGDSKKAAQLQKDSIRKALAYSYKKVNTYVLQLYSAYFSAAINNDYFINRYQPFQAYLGTFKFPEVGAMITGGFSDLFENHQFNIGYRLPAGTEGSDFFVRYENSAKKTDWHVLFFRKVESLQPDPQRDWKDARGNPYPAAAKVKTHYYELGFHTPLHYDWSLDYSLAARRDRTIFLATDRYSLNYEALQSWWGIGNIALKAHKMRPTIPLLEKGWEGKILLDGMASTGKQSTIVYGGQFNFSYSQPIIKNITIVARLQAGYSGGQSKILYNFGGMDNNVVTRIDTSVHFGQDAPFAFQTLVTPFRGYEQNSIYGSRYGLLNLDLYFPLFRSLIPLHTSFSSLNNLQIGLFTDIAKTGGATGLPVTSSQLNSFGFSVRTMLAGYPLRFDMAWPGNFNKTPVWYLSLALK